jgi:ribonuclease P protein component
VPDFRLSKAELIKKKTEFELLFSNGASKVIFPLKVLFVNNPSRRVAFAVPKRVFKKAHDRNRIRRLMREGYRLNKNLLPQGNNDFLMLFIYIGKKLPTWSEIDLSFKKLAREFPFVEHQGKPEDEK